MSNAKRRHRRRTRAMRSGQWVPSTKFERTATRFAARTVAATVAIVDRYSEAVESAVPPEVAKELKRQRRRRKLSVRNMLRAVVA